MGRYVVAALAAAALAGGAVPWSGGPGARAARATAADLSVQVVSQNPDVYLDAVDPSGNAYGTPVSNDHDIMRSRDEGQTWSLVYSFPSSYTLWFISALASGTVLAHVDTGAMTLFRSTDEGATWTRVLALPSSSVFYTTLTPASIADGGGYVWLGTYNTGQSAAAIRTSSTGRPTMAVPGRS